MDPSQNLSFKPLLGFSSPHLQTILPSFLPPGKQAPSEPWIFTLSDGDRLSLEVSNPPEWQENHPTTFLIHGLGGDHTSSYMIRVTRKLYQKGHKVIRINLRGCGSGKGLSTKPYYGGNSQDILEILLHNQKEHKDSPTNIIGFSLGGNITLKLCGELEERLSSILNHCIAVCPPLDLFHAVQTIGKKPFYERYFLKSLTKQFYSPPPSMYLLDENITAPAWGYESALDYYQSCSSLFFIPKIKHKTRILFAKDDPFIDHTKIDMVSLPDAVQIYTTEQGGHMGFLGANGNYWMDDLLLEWLS
jgi:uncharacterized protein